MHSDDSAKILKQTAKGIAIIPVVLSPPQIDKTDSHVNSDLIL